MMRHNIEAMIGGWAYIGPTTRWATIWVVKDGYLCLNAFSSGAWSITRKAAATDDNPHGIVASSWEDGPVCSNLDDAMAAAEAKAANMGAVSSKQADADRVKPYLEPF